jgi:hypothetical protein
MQLDVLADAVAQLVATDPFSYADKESIVQLHRIAAQLDYAISRAAVSFDAGGEWSTDGAQTSVAWVDTRCHLPRRDARRALRLGKALAQMPLADEAWANGDIGAAQVEVLVRLRSVRTEEAFARDEEILVDQAKRLKFAPFHAAASYWDQLADPDGAGATDMARRARRDVYVTRGVDGMWHGEIKLDPISGAIVSGELARLERLLFEADWARAKDELGREPKVSELWRTSPQRRADAMEEMATRSAATPADAQRPRPLFSIMVGWETLHGRICQLADGLVLSPDSLLSWLASAEFERAVFAPGKRVEVSVRSRLFKGATRRAIELRDHHCTHPYCDLSADRCQIDHVIAWERGGPTTQENGRVLCGYHNRLRNQGREPPDQGPG